MKVYSCLLILCAGVLLGACDKIPGAQALLDKQAQAASASAGAVAIIDLAAVAKALGRDEVLKQQVQAAGEQLQQQVTEFTTGLQDKLREEQAKLGGEPSEAERQQLQKQLIEAQRQVQQSQVLARQKAVQFQNQLALQFRDEIKPVAAEIAAKRGATTILLSNTVMWFEPAIDITGAVIDAMRAKGATTGAPLLAPSTGAGAGAATGGEAAVPGAAPK